MKYPLTTLHGSQNREREFFIDNLLVRNHFFIEMIWWTGFALSEVEFLFTGSLVSTFLAHERHCRTFALPLSSEEVIT